MPADLFNRKTRALFHSQMRRLIHAPVEVVRPGRMVRGECPEEEPDPT